MAWTSPMTAVAGAVYTAAQFNTHTRDNLLALRATPEYRCSAYHNTTQTVSASATAALSLNAEDVDTATMHDLSTNNSRVVIPSGGGGTYVVTGSTEVSAASNCSALLTLRKNGSTALQEQAYGTTGGSLPSMGLVVSRQVVLAAADYLELVMTEGTGNGSLTVGSATASRATRLEVLGPWVPT